MQETLVRFLGQEASLEKGQATYFSGKEMVKHLPAMRENWVQSLGWEDPLEVSLANPLQYSCLENPTGRAAWGAKVHGITKSRTQLND